MNIFPDFGAYELPSSDFCYKNLNYNKKFEGFFDGFLWAHQEKLESISPMQTWNDLFDNGKIQWSPYYHNGKIRIKHWSHNSLGEFSLWALGADSNGLAASIPHKSNMQMSIFPDSAHAWMSSILIGIWGLEVGLPIPPTFPNRNVAYNKYRSCIPKHGLWLWRCYCWRLGECPLEQASPQRKVK